MERVRLSLSENLRLSFRSGNGIVRAPADEGSGFAEVVTALWHADAEETLPTPAPNDDCPNDIPEHFDLDLHVGTWNIGVGPAGVAEVWLMLSPAGDHAHEE